MKLLSHLLLALACILPLVWADSSSAVANPMAALPACAVRFVSRLALFLMRNPCSLVGV